MSDVWNIDGRGSLTFKPLSIRDEGWDEVEFSGNINLNRASASGNFNSKENITPMKLTFNRIALIASMQKVISDAKAAHVAKVAEIDAALAPVRTFVESQKDAIAKYYGLDNATQVTAAHLASSTDSVASCFGIIYNKPTEPKFPQLEGFIATLSAATGDTLEVEENHPWLQHLKG